jgi:hypothetical protein
MSQPSTLRAWITRLLLFVAALVLLLEEWVWRSTASVLRRIGRWPGFAALEGWIVRRPRFQALALFILPVLAMLPLKSVGVMAFSHGHLFTGTAAFVLDKIVGTALFARLYQLTEPAITQIGWVLRGRDGFLRMRSRLYEWLHEQPAYRRSRALLQRLRRSGGIRRRFRAAMRRQRQRAAASAAARRV